MVAASNIKILILGYIYKPLIRFQDTCSDLGRIFSKILQECSKLPKKGSEHPIYKFNNFLPEYGRGTYHSVVTQNGKGLSYRIMIYQKF